MNNEKRKVKNRVSGSRWGLVSWFCIFHFSFFIFHLFDHFMIHPAHECELVLPAELGRQPPAACLTQPAADMMETKLRRLGFVVADRLIEDFMKQRL